LFPLDATVNFSLGDAYDDGNTMTNNDTINASCMCQGEASADPDDDGIADANDNCPDIISTQGMDMNGGNDISDLDLGMYFIRAFSKTGESPIQRSIKVN